MNTQHLIDLIISMMEQKVEELGGVDTIKKAIIWDWWKNAGVYSERDFDSAIDECYRCYLKVEKAREEWNELMEVVTTDEDTTNLPS